MTLRTPLVFIGALSALFNATALPAAELTPWTIIPQTSSIRFSGLQMGQPLAGQFERFGGKIEFEPGVSPQGNVRVDVDVTSIKTGADDRDSMALGNDWFIAGRIPIATFEAHVFVQTAPDAYEANGDLTIKGVTIPVTLPFTLHLDPDGEAEMKAQVVLDRQKFGLGTGQFADFSIVSQNIQVQILLHAKRGP